MKGLWKRLTPFAPDQSGAVSVLYEMGGILVICDAGGCVGNVCGFDEPRWFTHRSAIFSAGLRDMDAIMGRDERLVDKLVRAAEDIDASFAALIGTPVPAVIGTDDKALGRTAERKSGLPVITIDSNGMELYDAGEEKAYLALISKFVTEVLPVQKGKVGVFGCTPLDFSDLSAGDRIRRILHDEGYVTVHCYGMGDGLDALRVVSSNEKNFVVSPAGLQPARELMKRFGTPYEIRDPLAAGLLPHDTDWYGKKVLVVDQQVRACSIAKILRAQGAEAETACWFMCRDEIGISRQLKGEDDYHDLVAQGAFDVIIGDPVLQSIDDSQNLFVPVQQFATSGQLI